MRMKFALVKKYFAFENHGFICSGQITFSAVLSKKSGLFVCFCIVYLEDDKFPVLVGCVYAPFNYQKCCKNQVKCWFSGLTLTKCFSA